MGKGESTIEPRDGAYVSPRPLRRPADGRTRAVLAALFVTGLAIALVMVWRSQVAGDALAMLTRGWLLAAQGIWVPFGNPVASTTGGQLPGGLMSLVVGAPLMVWMDHRAPVLLILASHVLAYFLLDRVVARTLGARARILLAVVYWLNPWRLYQSAWLDNSNYVFLAGAVHAWATWRQARSPSWYCSAVLVAVVGLTGQLHMCATLLVIASVLLWLRGYWKPHWGGVALGTAITVGALVPYFLEAARHPEILPGGGDPPGTGLILGWPVPKGISYWFRYASLAVTKGMNVYDFTPSLGAAADAVLAPLYTSLGRVVVMVTVIPAVLANWRGWKRHRVVARSLRPAEMSDRSWLRGYAVWVFLAGVVSNAISPTGIMWWHNLTLFHAALLPLVLWADALLRTPRATWVRRGTVAWVAFSLVLLFGMTLAAEQYRHGGREAWVWVVARNDQAIRDLRLTQYGISINRRKGREPQGNRLLYAEYMAPFQLQGRKRR